MEKRIDTLTDERDLKAVAIMLRALASETRLHILNSLYTKPKTWTELILELQMNPKSLRDNLLYLRKSKLIQRRKPVGFELTETGEAVMELSLKELLRASQGISE